MAYVKLMNNLSDRRPKLTMRLVAWGDKKWPPEKYLPPYDIDPGSERDMPGSGSTNTTDQWSSWNIVDEKGQYFGNITLESDNDKGTAWMREPHSAVYKAPDHYRFDKSSGHWVPSSLNYLPPNDITLGQNKPGLPAALFAKRVYADRDPPFLAPGPAKPAVYPRSKEPIWLSTEGPKIMNNRGAEVWLKGLNRPSLEWNAKGQYLSPLDIETMRGWGANVIRIPLDRDFWTSRATKDSYKKIVDAMIYYAIENKMAVILDLHRPPENMATQGAIDFWSDVAKTYGKFGTVLFDLFNEPYDPGRLLGKEISDKEKNQWLHGDGGYVGYQKLFDTVREARANNLCLVSGLLYAYRLEFVNKDFCVRDKSGGPAKGVVYCSHLYNGRGIDPQYGPPPVRDRTCFDVNFGGVDVNIGGVLNNFPVMLTEFGGNLWPPNENSDSPQYAHVTRKEDPPPPGDYTCTGGEIKSEARKYYETVIDWVNGKNKYKYRFHYTAWGWWVNNCEPWFPGLIKNLAGDAWNGGEVVQKDLKNNPGTDFYQTWSRLQPAKKKKK